MVVVRNVGGFGQIATQAIEAELQRRGIYQTVTPTVTPTTAVTPYIPESPAEPVTVLPDGERPPEYTPLLPTLTPTETREEVERFIAARPPEERLKISTRTLIISGVVIAAILLFAGGRPAVREAPARPPMTRRTVTEEYGPEEAE